MQVSQGLAGETTVRHKLVWADEMIPKKSCLLPAVSCFEHLQDVPANLQADIGARLNATAHGQRQASHRES